MVTTAAEGSSGSESTSLEVSTAGMLEVGVHIVDPKSPELQCPRSQFLLHLASHLLQERRVRRIFRRRVRSERQGWSSASSRSRRRDIPVSASSNRTLSWRSWIASG